MNYLIFTLSFLVFTFVFYIVWQEVKYYSTKKYSIFIDSEVYKLFNKDHINHFVDSLKVSIDTDLEQVKKHYKDDKKKYLFHKRHNYWGKVTEVRLEAETVNGKPSLSVWVDTIKLEKYAGYSMLLLDKGFDIAFWIHSSQKGLLQPLSTNTYHSNDYDTELLEGLYKQYNNQSLEYAVNDYLHISIKEGLENSKIVFDNSPSLKRVIIFTEYSNELHIDLITKHIEEGRVLKKNIQSPAEYRTEINEKEFIKLMAKHKIDIFTNTFNNSLYE